MTAAITTLSIKDGAGADRTVQAVDLSGTGAGPFSFLHGLVDASGLPISSTNSLPVSGDTAVGTAPTHSPVLTSGIDPAGLKRTHRTDGAGNLAVQNAPLRLRDQFETNTIGTNWTVTADPSDLVFYDGNALGAGYLVVSKDPMAAGTDTIVESIATWGATFRAGFGLSLSQRVLGQIAAVEMVSTDAPLTAITDAAIASISQAATTLTVTTAAAHGLKPGDRIAVSGVTANNALNYPQLVVATVANATQFTATAYPGSTIPSLTVGPYTTGTVRRVDHLGSAADGTAMIFEGASATGATFAVRGGGTTANVSGTVNGNQIVTIGSSASTQLLASTALYAFAPSTQFELFHQLEVLEWLGAAVDTSSSPLTPYFKRSQIVPDPAKSYKLRFRATNTPSLARPVAAIVSAVKTGTTTATVTTDRAHGLTTGETVTLHGSRDAANFANVTTATAVTVVDATHFTVTWAAAVTSTAYGGVVCRAGGGQVQAGVATQVVQSASTNATGIATLVGSAAWSGMVIGDTVSLYGLRSAADGSSLGLDGAYRVRDGSNTTSLVLEPIGATAIVANLASTNCGGAVIKRTDLRIHFIRVAEINRLVTESAGGTSRLDMAAATPVMVPTGYAVGIQGSQADQSAANALGVPVQVQTLSSQPTAGTTGRRSTIQGDLAARPVMRPIGMPQANAYGRVTLTTTTETTLLSATASNRWELDNVVIANRDTVAHTVDIRDALAGTVRWSIVVPAGTTQALSLDGAPSSAANAAVTAALREAATTAVEVAVNAYLTTA